MKIMINYFSSGQMEPVMILRRQVSAIWPKNSQIDSHENEVRSLRGRGAGMPVNFSQLTTQYTNQKKATSQGLISFKDVLATA